LFLWLEKNEETSLIIMKERLTDVAFLRYGNSVDALEPERIAG
jgi:hypothetical protein